MTVDQIVRARRNLSRNKDHAVAIHEARKCLKRVRALLRLVRPALTKEQYRRENARFRDIARLLSPSRDRQVMRETVAHLATDANGQQRKALQALGQVLSKDTSDGSSPHDLTKVLEAAISDLGRAKKDIKHLDPDLKMRDSIRIGLMRSYRSGQEALAVAIANPDDETLHEWRKTVQVHWRHMLLLSEAWPEYFAVRSNAAKELSEWLGEDHDLAVLIDFVSNGDGSVIGSRNAEAIVVMAAGQQQQLRKRAFQKGAYLFAADAKELANAVQRYWSLARDQSQADDDAASNGEGAHESAGPVDDVAVLAER